MPDYELTACPPNSLFLVISTAAGETSAAIQCLFICLATNAVVPDPQKKSATVSPSSVDAAIILRSSASGFWVG